MATSQHVSADYPETGCLHEPGDEVYSQGGTLLGGRCKLCLSVFGLGRCSGCEQEKRLWVVSESGEERYCGDICRRVHIAMKANGEYNRRPSRQPVRKPSKGRK